MIKLEDFRNDLLEEAKIETQQSGMGDCASFIQKVIDYYAQNGLMEDYTPCFFSKQLRNGAEIRFDGFATDSRDESIYLVIGIYKGTKEIERITKTEVQTAIERASRFLTHAFGTNAATFRASYIDFGTPAYDLFNLLRERQKNNELQQIKYTIVTDCKLSERLKSLDIKDVEGIPTSFDIIDIDKLYSVVVENGLQEELEIDLSEFEGSEHGLICIEIPQATDLFKCYLSVMPGKTLSKLYQRYGSKLLEGNVRSFLTTKKAVNQKIRSTILSQPKNFFVYNNGIAVTSTGIELEEKNGIKIIKKIKDLQIINGGQTTASLASCSFKDHADLSNISVQMKLTVINAENSEENNKLIQEISRSSNSQNPVSNADFFSNHPFQQKIKDISESSKVEAPRVNNNVYSTRWFYERSNGEYNQKKMFMTPAKAKEFEDRYPKKQIITKTSLAKAYNLYFEHHPDLVSKGAMTNFTKFANTITEKWGDDNDPDETKRKSAIKYRSNFNSLFYMEIATIHILIDEVGRIVSSQDWYDGSYRANIVAYSIAWFFTLIEKHYPDKCFDYHTIWNKQCTDEKLNEIFVDLTKTVYNYIVHEGKQQNITQWCKKAECWRGLQLKEYYDYRMEEYTVDKKIIKEEEKAAQENAKDFQFFDYINEAQKFSIATWLILQDKMAEHTGEFPDSENKAVGQVISYLSGKISYDLKTETCQLALKAMHKACDRAYIKT